LENLLLWWDIEFFGIVLRNSRFGFDHWNLSYCLRRLIFRISDEKTFTRSSAMVDNIKLNKILPSLSPAPKVKRADSRGRNRQQTPFKESFEQEQKKKKKEDPDQAGQPDNGSSTKVRTTVQPAVTKGAVKRSQTDATSRDRLIDILV
jgi:hypothetical protein